MRLLILGGTRFLGRAVAAGAVARGWRVTALHRGTAAPPAQVESLLGDRTDAAGPVVAEAARRRWDLVLDTWDGPPEVVDRAATALAASAGRYVYVSSRSVYRDLSAPGLVEESALVAAPPAGTAPERATFGQLKAGAERRVRAAFGERALIVRPGLVLGPREHPERLVWWLRRLARGGDVPVPGPPGLPVQYVDVRDLARWLLDAAAAGRGGTFNAVSPPGHTTMGALLASCRDATGSGARLRWVPPGAVLAAGVLPWSELPIWIPEGSPVRGLHETAADRAYAAGLRCRPIAETVADTWAWLRPSAHDGPAGLGPDREAELLRHAC
ncbi:NAD-dependent epimerase/dehydratase family protein [Catellatospora sp. NPDC049609]|uniref:NAD-dependent epimerase/dehydratase family protein n=1 Tax=Catellatospora sp. NPDC049609 TaxID=3155505 RepID=UPI003414D9A7